MCSASNVRSCEVTFAEGWKLRSQAAFIAVDLPLVSRRPHPDPCSRPSRAVVQTRWEDQTHITSLFGHSVLPWSCSGRRRSALGHRTTDILTAGMRQSTHVETS